MTKRDPAMWNLEPHVCRVCFARVTSRPDGDGCARLYACSNCGAEAVGSSAAVICACGAKVRKGKHAWADAGLRCHENKARSPEFPSLFTASHAGIQQDT